MMMGSLSAWRSWVLVVVFGVWLGWRGVGHGLDDICLWLGPLEGRGRIRFFGVLKAGSSRIDQGE